MTSHGPHNLNHNNYGLIPANKLNMTWNNFGTNMPTAGDTEMSYDGNEYNIIGCQLYWMIQFPADRSNAKVRILIVRHNIGKTFSGYTDLFDSITGNTMIDPVDKGKVSKVLYDRQITQGALNVNGTFTAKIGCVFFCFIRELNPHPRPSLPSPSTHLSAHTSHTTHPP